MSIRNPVSCEYEAFLRITGIVKSELQDLSEFPDIVLPRAPEVQPDALVGQGKARDLGRRIREVRMSTDTVCPCPRLCSGTVAGQAIGQGISTLRYRDRICRSRHKVQVYTNPHKIFLFFYFFLFFEMPFRVFIFCGESLKSMSGKFLQKKSKLF